MLLPRLGEVKAPGIGRGDEGNHRVMRWNKEDKEGTIIVGGNGQGSQSNQLNHPYGLQFDQQRNFYVVDRQNHRIQKFEIDLNENNFFQ